MLGVRIRVAQIIDFGPTVAIVGNELVSGLEVVLHVDYRPLRTIRDGWQTAGLSERIKFGADGLVMRLDLDGAATPDGGMPQSGQAA